MGEWVWDGGRPCVDLLNTLRDRLRGGRELLRSSPDLVQWLCEADLYADDAAAGDEDLATARRLRGATDAAVFAAAKRQPVPQRSVEIINEVAAAVPLTPRLTVDDAGRPYVAPVSPPAAAALARIALDAIDLITSEEIIRLRVCAARDCAIRFVDRSPAQNRQWCSMRRCGNRTKASRHYARTRNT